MAEHIEYNGNFSGSQIDTLLAKIQSSQVFTTEEKTKLSNIESEANKTIVDSTLSTTSTNPVQNKVINIALSGKQDTISDLETIRTGAELGATAVQPEAGKGLSTNDFTNSDKEQIETNKNNISSLWDVGAKNTFNISATPISENVTYSISGGSILVQSTGRYARIAIPYIFKKGTYIFTSTVSNLSITGGGICIRFAVNPSSSNPVAPEIIVATNGDISKNITINADTAGYVIYYINTSDKAFTNSATFSDNMIRLASIDDINYQPYAPTNRELYEMILALQSSN
jgi:hypothetical protein